MTAISDIRAASATFYAALNGMAAGNAAPMAEAWAKGPAVSAQHPIGGRTEGYDSVIASFAKVAEIAGGGEIRIVDQVIDAGTDLAVETGVETGSLVLAGHNAMIQQRVTNIYRKTDAGWKLAHHHTDLSPAMLDVLKRLNEPA
jgi:ketosteroid isomerase-like protein